MQYQLFLASDVSFEEPASWKARTELVTKLDDFWVLKFFVRMYWYVGSMCDIVINTTSQVIMCWLTNFCSSHLIPGINNCDTHCRKIMLGFLWYQSPIIWIIKSMRSNDYKRRRHPVAAATLHLMLCRKMNKLSITCTKTSTNFGNGLSRLVIIRLSKSMPWKYYRTN